MELAQTKPMSGPLKIGLLGCGQIGRLVHLESLRRLRGVQITSLADADKTLLAAAQGRCHRAVGFETFSDVFSKGDVDAVIISLPNALHAEAAVAAFEAGKHVYLEKPLALAVDDGKKVVNAWHQSGRVGMMGFNYRFNPLHQNLRRLLREGVLGEVIGIRSVWTTRPHQLPAWKRNRKTGGGVLLDLASHHFDLIHFWFEQEIVETNTVLRSCRTEGDTATVRLRLANGLPVESFFSSCSIDDDRFEIYGSAGKLSLDRYHGWNVELTDVENRSIAARYLGKLVRVLPRSRFAIGKLRAPGVEPSFRAALEQFVRAAQGGQQIQPDLHDGLRSLEVVIASEESARIGRPVTVASQSERNNLSFASRASLTDEPSIQN
jgi:myo-inositol 2-dehydrogenase / D-chiro-inositol 1-dehydrogenase